MDDAQILWDYHQMHHEPRNTDVAIGLGSHDIGVAEHAAHLYHQGRFPLIVFTGANAPTTVETFPRGEAVHYAERAEKLGVPDTAIVLEEHARNTGENFTMTRALLDREGIHPTSATIISRPYQQRRAYATCRKLWPELDVICSSRPQSLSDYITSIGDQDKVLTMLVGDTQRIWVYAEQGFATPQTVPRRVWDAYQSLVATGFTSRIVREAPDASNASAEQGPMGRAAGRSRTNPPEAPGI
ncbi:YdcF family protein [Phycicoccus sp. Soil748]|uniref:YdcF family protein n=1 Tax=Phycicoccus sp. Soil748 TaxID=1736397 RepID=UPI0009EAC520|nr:YdcF family protein [Phycicoccus sp. Soil748]